MGKSGRFSVEIGQQEGIQAEETQQERFRRVAQELGCNEDEAAFDEKLKLIAKRKTVTKTNGKD